MPHYEYYCTRCAQVWDKHLTAREAMGTTTHESDCPQCQELCQRVWDPPMLHWNWEDVSGTSLEKTRTEVQTDRHFRNKEMIAGWHDMKRDGYEFGPGEVGAKARTKHVRKGGRQV